MAQRLSRSSTQLRLAFDASSISKTSKCHPRRTFVASAPRCAKARTGLRRQEMPARPSMATTQREQMKGFRKEDIPEDIGLMRVTYILPPKPRLWQDPKLRLAQLYQFFKQDIMETLQSIITKMTFYSSIPPRDRPTLPRSYFLLPWRPPQIKLQTLQLPHIIKDLHKRSYQAIQHAVSTGDMKPIKATCGPSLQEHYARLVRDYTAKREVVKWDVRYKPFPFGLTILSRKFGQAPLSFEGLPIGLQQVVARINSSQTLTPGRITGKHPQTGEVEVVWGEPKTRDVSECIVVRRKYVKGEFEPWRVSGFRSLKGTREELDEWLEEQMRIPGEKGEKAAEAGKKIVPGVAAPAT